MLSLADAPPLEGARDVPLATTEGIVANLNLLHYFPRTSANCSLNEFNENEDDDRLGTSRELTYRDYTKALKTSLREMAREIKQWMKMMADSDAKSRDFGELEVF
jgi:hypothetical protein